MIAGSSSDGLPAFVSGINQEGTLPTHVQQPEKMEQGLCAKSLLRGWLGKTLLAKIKPINSKIIAKMCYFLNGYLTRSWAKFELGAIVRVSRFPTPSFGRHGRLFRQWTANQRFAESHLKR